jgi:hypothetical protein
MERKDEVCPEHVFILPLTASFKINGQEFRGTTIHMDFQEGPDPLFNLQTNWHIKPRLDYKQLMKDPMVDNKPHFIYGRPSDHSDSFWM